MIDNNNKIDLKTCYTLLINCLYLFIIAKKNIKVNKKRTNQRYHKDY